MCGTSTFATLHGLLGIASSIVRFETPVLTRATRRNIPQDGILHSFTSFTVIPANTTILRDTESVQKCPQHSTNLTSTKICRGLSKTERRFFFLAAAEAILSYSAQTEQEPIQIPIQ
jgi:hypothetical protein